MCGIAGYVIGSGAARVELVELQLAQLGHRGPDASGHFAGARGGIGQNRLSIIDLVHGDPPITDERDEIGVALNGEIYNFQALRDELVGEGHELRTRGDTEVIAHLAEERSPVELARRLDGMFAIAVWDTRCERLVLARDRLGKKPLYYWEANGAFVFGSEIKAVLVHPAVPRELNPRAIPAYLTFGYVPTPATFFADVYSVPPGHVLTLDAGGESKLERYWQPPRRAASGARAAAPSMSSSARAVRSAVTSAVERRLVADVPLGAFLSGGIDSSVIVAVMSELMGSRVQTFTIGFDDQAGYDERPYAAAVARRFGTDHTEFVVEPHAIELVDRLVWHHDQPFGDSSAIPTFLLAEMTGRHVTVALSGDGGDELFAGYDRFSAAELLRGYQRLPQVLRSGLERSVERLPRGALSGRAGSAQRFAHRATLGMPEAYLSWLSYVQEPRRADLLPAVDDWAIDDYRGVWTCSRDAHPLDRVLELNLRTYLLDDLLVKADRMSMAHGLEVRSPFLDTAMVELAVGLPPAQKLRGWSRKRVLKRAFADVLPAEVVRRAKRGFGVPLDRWFRGELQAYLESTLGAADARLRQHLEPAALDAVLHEHRSRDADHGHLLWALLTLELFLRREGW